MCIVYNDEARLELAIYKKEKKLLFWKNESLSIYLLVLAG